MELKSIIKQSLSFGTKDKIGLDIGTHSIKVVDLQDRQGVRVLRSLGTKEIPITHREEGSRDITDIAKLVEELFAELGIKGRGVVLAIPGAKVNLRVLKVPLMPEAELKEAIKWEMRRHVQFPIEEGVLDYSHMGKVMEEGATKNRVLVAAAPKGAVKEQLSIIREAGLHPLSIDVVPFAVWKAFEGIEKTPDRENVVLVDIGYKRTSISLISDNALQFARDATIGGNSFTEALLAPMTVGTTRVTLEYDEAERLKRRYGIPAWDSKESTEKDGIPLSQIYVMMRPVLEKHLIEIGRSFDFFARQLRVTGIDKIILSGGGARVKGLPEFLAQGLKMDVEVADPLRGIPSEVKDVEAGALKEMSPNFTVATGLALTMPERIDLIPEEIKAKRQMVLQGAVAACTAFVMLLTFGILFWSTGKELSTLRRELSSKRSQLSAMETSAFKLPQLRELREKVRLEKSLLPAEPFERYPWTDIMKEISNAVPPKVMLTRFSVDAERVVKGTAKKGKKLMRLKGIVYDRDPDDRVRLNEFIRLMEPSPLFTNVRLVSTSDITGNEQIGKRFEFECVPVSERRTR